MRISAKVDYAVRALCEIAARSGDVPVKADEIARAQDIPHSFLENILVDLRRAGFVRSLRGQVGGYRMATAPSAITIADVIRAIDGPLANVAGVRPDALDLTGSAEPLQQVWVSLRSSIRTVLEHVTIADVVSGDLPQPVVDLARDREAWQPH